MKAKIYIHRDIVANNKHNNTDIPCISVRTRNRVEKAHEVLIQGSAKLCTTINNEGNPSVWIETDTEYVTIINR